MVFTSGIAVDIMRYETHRARLQGALDSGVLAAANVQVCLDPDRNAQEVVQNYVDAQGFGDLITNIVVTPGENECSIEADADLMINTIFMRLLSYDDIGGLTASAANHALGTLEISLVLDTSTSMARDNRMDAMRPAAANFVSTLYGPDGDNDVVMNLVPYATQVSLGPDLLSQYSLAYAHDFSTCIDLPNSMYEQTMIPTNRTYAQSAHFDPFRRGNHFEWIPDPTPTNPQPESDNTERDSWGGGGSGTTQEIEVIYELTPLGRTPCNPHPNSYVLPYQTSPNALLARIDDLYPLGDTSINHGALWGVALLDPAAQPVVNGLIADEVISPSTAGLPAAHDEDTMKVLVLMSDGINTTNFVMPTTHRDQLSNVWLGRMTPSGPETDHFTPGYYDPYNSADGFQQGTDDPESNSYYFVESQEPGDADGDGIPNESHYVVLMEYVHNLDPNDALRPQDVWTNDVNGVQQTWQQLWSRWVVHNYIINFLRDPLMSQPYQDYYSDFLNLLIRHEHEEKNAQLQATCDAARNEGVIVYTIGFEISDLGAQVLADCATSPAHFYRAEQTSIDDTFASIAASIKALRLTQ